MAAPELSSINNNKPGQPFNRATAPNDLKGHKNKIQTKLKQK